MCAEVLLLAASLQLRERAVGTLDVRLFFVMFIVCSSMIAPEMCGSSAP